jgi:hypothetical protein
MILISAFVANLAGFAMGQQASSDNCKRFGMSHYSGNVYSCQQVKANDVVVTDFKEEGK